MKLVIAEKRSVAETIAKILNANKRGDGFFITDGSLLDTKKSYSTKKQAPTGNDDVLDDSSIKIISGGGYVVTWAIGHLTELAMPEAYDERIKAWKLETLPVIPDRFKTVVSKSTEKQYKIVKELMNSGEVTDIICATDAGREGELIFRRIYEKAGCRKPVKRLWVSSMETAAVKRGLSEMKDWSEYDNLYYAADCRQKSDWLVGMNLTRMYSILHRRTLNTGRVQTPTLALIVKRQAEIENFKPE
ncbi:MAG: hypothetical protein LBI03_05495, partial [Clostridiales bacterium]|nr:hypothetical protein [Clostridiales bacterium]